jgi:hypothetical protein
LTNTASTTSIARPTTSIGALEDSVPWMLAGIAGIVAGGIHLAFAPGHFSEASGQGLFFMMLGTLQVGWGFWHLGRPSYWAWLAGIPIAIGSILVYVAALLIETPFSEGPEPFDYAGLFTKLVEGATVVFLVLPLVRGNALKPLRPAPIVASLLAILIGVAGAGAALGVGFAVEAVAPSLGEPSSHAHGEEDEHGHDEAAATSEHAHALLAMATPSGLRA